MKNFLYSTFLLACSLSVLSACGVVPEHVVAPPDAEIILYPPANFLEGIELRDVLVRAKQTVRTDVMDTRLHYRVAKKAADAVVSIFVKGDNPARFYWLPFKAPGTSFRISVPGAGLGSGFFVHPKGYVMTNNHVVENADQIKGQLKDGTEFAMDIVARDPVYDVALLKVRDPDREYVTLPIGDVHEMGSGDHVIAIGNPLGLGHTVTAGVISRRGRRLTEEDVEGGRYIHYIQTDSAINPGSSGGPLISLTGAWVGINTAGITKGQSIGFAVPSYQVLEFIDLVFKGDGVPAKN